MTAFSNSAVTAPIADAFPYCNPFLAALTSPSVGSFTVFYSAVFHPPDRQLWRFAGASLLSTSLKCSVHLALTSLLLLMRFPFLSRTDVLCLALSLHRIFVSPYIVFMSCLFAASSASSAMSSIQFLSSAFILLLNSQSFSVYFALICPLTLSDRVLRIFFIGFFPLVYKVPWFVTGAWFLPLSWST